MPKARPAPKATSAETRARPLRPEIQALRAIAVLGVVLYHLWPDAVRGGFAGVDVFFVISGFLITSHLLREVARSGRIRFAAFWARRARRLLPASLLVIAVSLVVTIAFVPQASWDQFLSEFRASALYFENWVLAGNSVDYFASTNAPSPVQHYWSLSVEEQFYVVWPLLISLGVLIAAKIVRGGTRAKAVTVGIILGVVTLASLAYGILLVAQNDPAAYFVTTARAWEFGLGGVLALVLEHVPAMGRRLALTVSWVATIVLLAFLVLYPNTLPFPGWEALIPAVATAAIIAAGSPAGRFSLSNVFGLRPVQWTGDVSYSLYLWHWPPIVLLPIIVKHPLNLEDAAVILVGSFVLAALTRTFVENPVRRSRFLGTRTPYLTLGAMVIAAAIVVTPAQLEQNTLDTRVTASLHEAKVLQKSGADCFGAAAFDPADQPCVNHDLDDVIVPDQAAGLKDGVEPPHKNCRAYAGSTGVVTCQLATGDGLKVALVGDSHAEHWIPAMTIIAKQEGWSLTTYLKGGCPFSAATRTDHAEANHGTCAVWNTSVRKKLVASGIQLVVTSAITGSTFAAKPGQTSNQAAVAGLVARWSQLEAKGIRVVAIRDDPTLPMNVPDCLSNLGDRLFQNESKCEGRESSSILYDPQVDAATQSGAGLIDLTPFFCRRGVCPGVIGSVVVYRDNSHLGGTFSRTLAPFIRARLLPLLDTLSTAG